MQKSKKYCMDCGHYLPHGVEHNCTIGIKTNDRYVCALKEACESFVDREDEEAVVFAKIEMRKPKRRRKK